MFPAKQTRKNFAFAVLHNCTSVSPQFPILTTLVSNISSVCWLLKMTFPPDEPSLLVQLKGIEELSPLSPLSHCWASRPQQWLDPSQNKTSRYRTRRKNMKALSKASASLALSWAPCLKTGKHQDSVFNGIRSSNVGLCPFFSPCDNFS